MANKKFSSLFSGKGYYIALILCAAAIGISGYLYYRNANRSEDAPVSANNTLSQSGTQVSTTTPEGTPSEPTTTREEKKSLGKLTRPVSGETVLGYAMDVLCYNPTTRDWRVHSGIDIAAQAGTPVCAAADGTVYTVYEDETMGTTVVIRHDNGYVTKYASLSEEISVKAGDKVTSGQTIGTVGNTALLETAIGEHVHFSVTCDGLEIDPEAFLSQS